MSIEFLSASQQFNLFTQNNQLSLKVLPSGHLVQLYFGKKIGSGDLSYLIEEIGNLGYLADTANAPGVQLELLPQVYPTFGTSDLRTPALQFIEKTGHQLGEFLFNRYAIHQGKEKIAGLPATFADEGEVATLEIVLQDKKSGREVTIFISAFEKYDVFTKHVQIRNFSTQTLELEKVMSLNVDFMRSDLDYLVLDGAWTRETQIDRQRLHRGFQGVDSKRGASGHGQNPFMALLEPATTWHQGAVYGFNLVYSGNFIASAEVDMYEQTRVQLGINPFNFGWQLEPGESFDTPEVVMVYAEHGLNEMAQRYHHFYLDCLLPQNFAKKQRPILINNWEATYFNFTKEKLLALAKEAAAVGVELFVLDDGWFGKRDNDNSSLGDWTVNETKVGGSLTTLIAEIKAVGLDFGLWVEPEMVSEDSELYRQHPDWIIQEEGRQPQQSRHQFVLDLSRVDVQDYIIATMTHLLTSYSISYIKWDMNRNITDPGSRALVGRRAKELYHRYILGLYRVLEKLTQTFPEVLFESCAGGGGRFDAGMLYYTPQIWTSDDTDAGERLAIQSGTSLVYPPVTMGCHVSAVPNHQVGRSTQLATRALVAQQGNFGYELNLGALAEDDKKSVAQQVALYKEQRQLLQFGVQTQLLATKETVAWQKLSTSECAVTYISRLARPNVLSKRLCLKGLDEQARYLDTATGKIYSGAELMTVGLNLPRPDRDFLSKRWLLKKQG